MTKGEQKQFIKELIDSVHSDLRDSIDLDKIPEDWDGHELRTLIADKFADCRMGNLMWGSRLKAYKNILLVNNI